MPNAPARLMLKPGQLRLLHEIARHGQLQLAALACAMSQPAASRMLAEIERRVGAPLFLRQPKGLEPTEIGRTVLRRTGVILREMLSMAADVSALQEGLAGSAHIGAVTGPAVGYLVSAVREIKARSPEADITIDVLPSRDLLTRLAAGELDFVLARILPEFDSRDFTMLPMRDEKVSFLVREDHPLNRAAAVTLTELFDYEWIMQQRGAPIREATLAAFASFGLGEPPNILSSPSLLFIIAYLSQSDAVAALSQEVAQLLALPPVSARFASLPVRRDVRVPPYFLLNLRRRPLSPLAERLRESVIAHSRDGDRDVWRRILT
ncbi:LysR family transcriptional regulator [Amaricoccus sp.]|uniref:LysR family transcriptional regulator n=1 Tax=Amaricoccus sp. TaxID=1872485 RepID=UPI001B764B5F|nr:LysR family transcriptional regulator [Amaricoccus sp.]MBP7243331.1 LysR family transcriptional regulator [Amaricoccus sp.]